MKASIRKFSLRDYTQVMALWHSCEGVGLTDADSREGIHDFLRRNPGLSFVAVKDRQIVGSALRTRWSTGIHLPSGGGRIRAVPRHWPGIG